jgi:hypothetical protein
MLIGLKKAINEHRRAELFNDVLLENSADQIKSMFLDDPDVVTIGAENDPEIKSLVNDLPEYGGEEEEIEDEIKSVSESLTETSLVKDNN